METPPTATAAGGKHPTGMHSCLKCNISNTFSKTYWSFAEDLCQAKHDAGVENFVSKNPLGGGEKLRSSFGVILPIMRKTFEFHEDSYLVLLSVM